MRRSWQHGPVFSRAGRSGGRPALQLPRASNPRGSSISRPRSRPRTAEAGISHPGTAPPLAKRSGGRQALQLPRASNSLGSSTIHLSPDRAPQKPEFPTPVLFSSICEEVWRATGPPAPASIVFDRKSGGKVQFSGNFSARRRQMFRNASRKIAPLILEVPALRSGKRMGNSTIRQPCR